MDSDQISVRVDPPGTKLRWPPELEAALAFLAQGDNVAQLDGPDATSIVLTGTFGRGELIALVEAWNPRLLCANGHRHKRDTQRPDCYCGARFVR